MDLRSVLFIGGSGGSMAAVQVRCIDVAQRVGCDYVYGVKSVDKIPDKFGAFVCVKPSFSTSELAKLAQRGPIIWDIIDNLPPREHVSIYLASTALAQHLFEDYGRVEIITHHHCNFAGVFNDPSLRRPGWVGSRHWRPRLEGFDYDAHFIEGMNREKIVGLFQGIGIGLNFRGNDAMPAIAERQRGPARTIAENKRLARNLFDLHLALNSGVKLINCIGFGIPSVSGNEPAYHEFGEHCTIFSTSKNCAKHVRRLQHEESVYGKLRQACLPLAQSFHIDTIAAKYKRLLASL